MELPATPISQALRLAEQALFLSNPNPRVGCVIVNPVDGAVLGWGHTQQAGGPHAEVMALRDAATHGNSVRGATAHVTLEPCAHHGRTGPCCDALVQAGIGRVVASTTDPNPLVAGAGLAKLKAAGVEIEIGPGAAESRELNIGFFSRMIRGLPWVRMKSAASLDGVTSLANGASQWITSPDARADGHSWRARACAVLTGVGTVLADDPRLDVRDIEVHRQPHLVIVDSQLQTPLDARLFTVPHRKIIIYTAQEPTSLAAQALIAQGATVVKMGNACESVDLLAMLKDLALQRQVNELHVEAGHRLNGALVHAGLVDEVLMYIAPILLGSGGRGTAQWGPLTNLLQGLRMEFKSIEPIGQDIRIVARPLGRADF